MTLALSRWRVVLALTAALTGAGVVAGPAQAEETAAWSASPSDASGVQDGRTRFELEVAAGAHLEEHVLVTNSSTTAREFSVYGADGFNTPSGGYDVDAAALPPTDVGSWVSVATPTVTIAPLATAVVAFTVTVPDGATPGDHPGGIVVAPVRAQVTDAGVLVDTRVAVRLNVRVPGELSPALEVHEVTGSYAFSAVPFASAPATVSYQVTNTGNVKVIGVPRVRISGPFGITLATVEADRTREVLPGDSFTVTTTVTGVRPVGWTTAVVDVDMTAAPGPDTTIPLVSSTARATVVAISWTGLLLVLLLVATVWFLVRRTRRRRREGAELWTRMVDEARRDVGPGGKGPQPAGARVAGSAALAIGLTLLTVPLGLGVTPAQAAPAPLHPAPAHAAPPRAPAVAPASADSDDGALSLTVPAATPAPSAGPAARNASATQAPVVPRSAQRPVVRSGAAAPAEGPVEQPMETPGPDPSPAADVAAEGGAPDLLWAPPGSRRTPLQTALLGLAAMAGAGAIGAAAHVALSRRGGGAA